MMRILAQLNQDLEPLRIVDATRVRGRQQGLSITVSCMLPGLKPREPPSASLGPHIPSVCLVDQCCDIMSPEYQARKTVWNTDTGTISANRPIIACAEG